MQLRFVEVFLVVYLTVLCSNVPCIEAASTERPYQFGFTIDKQQHRQEKKDERGIVMGEFGFITADGIYHVTVYATDEQGKFRILAMRSYPYEEHPKTIDMIVRPKPRPATPKPVTLPRSTTTELSLTRKFEKPNFSVQGCSGCFIKNNAPTTTTPIPKSADKKYDIRPLSKPLSPERGSINGVTPASNSNKAKTSTTNTLNSGNSPKATLSSSAKAVPVSTYAANDLATPSKDLTAPVVPSSKNDGDKSNTMSGTKRPGTSTGNRERAGNEGGNRGVDRAAGETGDLYRFKYILDYHGHQETGARNGNKEGSFFAIGDDNVERTIEYIANEMGYQPHIRWRKLDAPVPAKANTLKDYEFVWFKRD